MIPACTKGLVCDCVHAREAGFVVRPEGGGPYHVTLRDPWRDVATAINKDIQSGRPLENREHELIPITGKPEEESAEIQAIAHVIRVSSEGRLSVVHLLADNWPILKLRG